MLTNLDVTGFYQRITARKIARAAYLEKGRKIFYIDGEEWDG